MTKAIGAVAAMILVQRGVLDLDAPVSSVLPEFADLPLLTGWDGEAPRLRRPTRTATFRHLATHTSGLEYETWSPDIHRWRQATGRPLAPSGRLDALRQPLCFEPGIPLGLRHGHRLAGPRGRGHRRPTNRRLLPRRDLSNPLECLTPTSSSPRP